jgi:hypothetical protein
VFKSSKKPLTEMQGNAAYIRPKVVGPFPGYCTSRNYVHWANPNFASYDIHLLLVASMIITISTANDT